MSWLSDETMNTTQKLFCSRLEVRNHSTSELAQVANITDRAARKALDGLLEMGAVIKPTGRKWWQLTDKFREPIPPLASKNRNLSSVHTSSDRNLSSAQPEPEFRSASPTPITKKQSSIPTREDKNVAPKKPLSKDEVQMMLHLIELFIGPNAKLTKSEKGKFIDPARQLVEIEASIHDVTLAYKSMCKQFDEKFRSPGTLVKHWSRFHVASKPQALEVTELPEQW